MSDRFQLRSSADSSQLVLSGRQPSGFKSPVEYLHIEVSSPNVVASSARVYIYEPFSLVEFFAGLAEQWRGWPGERVWHSVEEDLCLVATSDLLGHIRMQVTIRSGPYPDDWTVRIVLVLDAGQLETIAGELQRFLVPK